MYYDQRYITAYDLDMMKRLIRNLMLSLFSRIFEIAQHLAKLWGKVDCLKRPVRRDTVQLKDEELA